MIKHNVEIGSSFKDPKHQEKRTSLRKTSLPFRLAIFFLIVITEIETLPVWHRRNPPIESPNDFALISAREFAKTISLGTNEDRWNLAEIIFKTENLNLTNFHNVTKQSQIIYKQLNSLRAKQKPQCFIQKISPITQQIFQ
jgi:hypothetical protein